MTDDEHLRAFEQFTLPFEQWNHRAHVKVAFTYLRRFPFREALSKLRSGIKAYNARHGVPENATSGYNETTTHAFLHLVAATMRAYGGVCPAAGADAFCDEHPQLMTGQALRFFYSPARRMDPRAKAEFVAPDLAPLPKVVFPEQEPLRDVKGRPVTVRLLDEPLTADDPMTGRLVDVFRGARHERLRFTLDLHDPAEDRAYFTGVILPENEVWIVEAGDEVAGFVAFAEGWLNHLYVAPTFQRRGIGSRLLAVARETASALQLWAFETNEPAIHFYQRHGFRVVQRTDGSGNEASQPDVRMAWHRG